MADRAKKGVFTLGRSDKSPLRLCLGKPFVLCLQCLLVFVWTRLAVLWRLLV